MPGTVEQQGMAMTPEAMAQMASMGQQEQPPQDPSLLTTISSSTGYQQAATTDNTGTMPEFGQLPDSSTTGGRRNLRHRRRLLEAAPLDSAGAADLSEYVQNHDRYNMLVNFDQDLPFQPATQTPYFWHIHKSGGSTMKHLMTCLNRTQTRRIDVPNCNDQESTLKICVLEWGTIVNCDASSPEGIERTSRLHLVERAVPNLVIDTSRVYEATSVFTPNHRGRLFVVLRDPVERAVSKFYYTKIATWERNYKPEMANMTMLEFADSRYNYNNWVTRRLVHKMRPDQEITEQDLSVAKEILRQKALILLTRNLTEGVQRLVQYFGWSVTPYQQSCVNKFAVEEPVNSNPHPVPSPDSEGYQAIRAHNLFDVRLYEYAQELYEAQGKFLQQRQGHMSQSGR